MLSECRDMQKECQVKIRQGKWSDALTNHETYRISGSFQKLGRDKERRRFPVLKHLK